MKKISDQILDLMKFATGRTFLYEEDSTCNDDWTKLIWSLIRIGGTFMYNRRMIGKVNESRRSAYGDVSLFDEINRKLNISEDALDEKTVSCFIIYAKESNEQVHQYEQLRLQ